MIDVLRDSLYLVSNALLVPVLLAVLLLAAWTVVLAGGIIREAIMRRDVRATFRETREALKLGGEGRQKAWECLQASCAGIPARFAAARLDLVGNDVERGKCLEDLESDIAVSLSTLSWITRIGPMLGLMGTLIPLGPALTGLAGGNIATLSSNLVVAFTTTVVGVFIGCAGFTMGLIRRNWYDRDMSDLEYLITRITEGNHPHAPKN